MFLNGVQDLVREAEQSDETFKNGQEELYVKDTKKTFSSKTPIN